MLLIYKQTGLSYDVFVFKNHTTPTPTLYQILYVSFKYQQHHAWSLFLHAVGVRLPPSLSLSVSVGSLFFLHTTSIHTHRATRDTVRNMHTQISLSILL